MVFTDLKVLRGMGKVNKKRKAGKINLNIQNKYAKLI
jgi:hypothetical protein